VTVTPLESRTAVRRYRRGAARIVAFERNITYHMSEDLKQAGGNESLETPVDVEARFKKPGWIYDLREGKSFGRTDRAAFRLDPFRPTVLAILEEEVPAGEVIERLLR
jgi:hypothetical protein